MLFVEFRFVAFFAVVFSVFWLLRGHRTRKLWLLVCSYAFYAAWDWRFLGLILTSTATDYIAARWMASTDDPRQRRLALSFSLGVNLGILGLFKYYDFFATSASELSRWLGLPLSVEALGWVLPVGISFYTFQTLSYSIDVYRRQLAPTRSFTDLALFVAFFPQLVAGPIVRARAFLPQLAESPRFANVDFRAHLTLFLVGYVKKACVADQVARVVDPVFAAPEAYGAMSKWLASFLYSLQIYCDFSGYSDMAIACAGLLGYRLTENFAFPYLARSFREYWRRWHISLSTWFRDYLYIPLGGNRAAPSRIAFNLCVVFFLCGLWHGAAWTFVLWGIYHGVFLSIERFVDADRLPAWIGHLYVLLGVNAGFVIFRAADLPTALTYLGGMLGFGSTGVARVDPLWWGMLAVFAMVHIAFSWRPPEAWTQPLPGWLFALAYGTAVALVLPWAASGYQPFIYFQF